MALQEEFRGKKLSSKRGKGRNAKLNSDEGRRKEGEGLREIR